MAQADGSILIDTKIDKTGLKKGLGALKKSAIAGGAAIGAAVGVAAVAFIGLAKAGEESATADARIRQINESMGLFGDQSGEVTKRIVAMAEAQARATGMDTNTIKLTQAKLLTFKELAATADEVGGAFDRAAAIALDMEAAGFGPADAAAVQLGKALNDPIKGITALNRSGITFTETEKELITAMVEAGNTLGAQDMILKAIETQVGGTAEATANATDKMGVAWDQAKEKIGKSLLPILEEMLPSVTGALDGISMLMAGDPLGADVLSENLGNLATSLADGITKILPGLITALASVIVSLAQALPALLPVVMRALIDGLTTLLTALPEILPALVDGLTEVITMLAEALPEMLPLMVTGLMTLITLLAESMGEMMPVLLPAIDKATLLMVEALIEALPQFIEAAFVLIGGIITGMVKRIPELHKNVLEMATRLAPVIKEAIPKILQAGKDLIVGLWNGMNDKVKWLTGKVKGLVGKVTESIKDFFGISSPSKLFEREIGVNLALGLGSGFEKSIGGVVNDMSRSVSGEMGRFATGASAIAAKSAPGTAAAQASSLGGIAAINLNISDVQLNGYKDTRTWARDLSRLVSSELRAAGVI